MNDSAHTPEPWRVRAWHSHATTTIVADTDPAEPLIVDGQSVVQYGHTEIADCAGSRRAGGDEANAARIAACVNACAGTPTEELIAAGTEFGMPAMDVLKGACVIATQQRDDLFAVLSLTSFLQRHAADESGPCLCSQCAFVDARDAAIAKAQS